jgi:hypothetical protein
MGWNKCLSNRFQRIGTTLDLKRGYNLAAADVDHVRCDIYKPAGDTSI